MKNVDLRVKAAAFLASEAKKIMNRPYKLTFSEKQVSSAVGGYAGALGQIAEDVADDLIAMGFPCNYYRNQKPTVFVITVV